MTYTVNAEITPVSFLTAPVGTGWYWSLVCCVVQAVKINEFVGLKFCEEVVAGNSSASALAINSSVNPTGLT